MEQPGAALRSHPTPMRPLLLPLTIAFALFTAAIVAHTGLAGFYRQLFDSPAAWQLLVDLTIALGLVLAWIWQDARRSGRAFWPWVALTLVLGSLGPLLYLLRRRTGDLPGQAPGRTKSAGL